jgi:hypothetical protein
MWPVMSGWKLSGYVIENLLGFGASGEVWRARVASTGEPVALKRIVVDGASRVRSAQAEAALLATLEHPHLVRLHELVPTTGAIVLVLDLAAGGTLAELINVRGRITPGEAITALAPIGAALAYAHNAGVVHGDVTPANVLFTDVGMPLLADLGVARLLGDDAPVQSTPAFIDPAVAAGCLPGPQSDVFMIAAVVVHALTGEPWWRGDTPAQVLASATAATDDEIQARLARLEVPDAVRSVLSRALAVAPGQRGSAAEFALDLRHAETPVAVELSAGRQRVAVVLPSTAGKDREAVATAGSNAPSSADAARPPFDRPRAPAPSAPSSAVLTHAVRARPRPAPARRNQRGRSTHGAAKRRVVAGVAGVAAVAVVVAAWATLGPAGTGGGSGHPPGASPVLGGPVPANPATASAPAGSPATSGPADASAVSAVLARLDTRRQRAFATRDVGLLGQVYVPGPLLSQDTALLEHLVPAGCGLVGVHTSYRHVRTTARERGQIEAAVSATMADSSLTCSGSASRRAPGYGPAELHIVLDRHGSGYLIAAIRR